MTPRILVISSRIEEIEDALVPLMARGLELFLVSDVERGMALLSAEPFHLILYDKGIVLPKTAAITVALGHPLDRSAILDLCQKTLQELVISPLRPM